MGTIGLDRSWKVLIVPHGVPLLMGLAYVAFPPLFLSGGFIGFAGTPWAAFARAEPVISAFIEMHGRETGAMTAAASLLALLVTLIPYRRGERWAWTALLAADTIGYGFMIYATAVHRDWTVFAVMLALLAIAYTGLTLGAGAMRAKSNR